MQITEILYIVALVLSILLTIFSFVTNRKSKKISGAVSEKCFDGSEKNVAISISTPSENNTLADENGGKSIGQTFKSTLEKVIGYIETAEKKFNSISTGKTGVMKLQEVLQMLKVDCLTENIEFDEQYWISIIEKIVEIMNFNKN